MIKVTRSSMPPFEEYVEEIRDLWESRWLTNMGEKHIRFQKELESFLGAPHVTLFTNGHLALENALAALGLPKGSEVITTDFTFASTTHAIVRSGLVPVFCDIKKSDFTLDPGKLEDLITPRTSAILPVHVYGNLCDDEAIGRIARAHGLKVIYDAAHAFGESRDNVPVSRMGDISVFSFHATKVFHTIEGGAAAYADGALEEVLDDLKNFGIRNPESTVYVGGNAKMSEFQAAMGLCNLRHFREEVEKRRRVFEYYESRLSGAEGLRIPESKPGTVMNYSYYPVVFESFRLSRDEAWALLKENGIAARKYFWPLTSQFECYRDADFAKAADTPNAHEVSSRVLTLPLYADLPEQDAERICSLLLK